VFFVIFGVLSFSIFAFTETGIAALRVSEVAGTKTFFSGFAPFCDEAPIVAPRVHGIRGRRSVPVMLLPRPQHTVWWCTVSLLLTVTSNPFFRAYPFFICFSDHLDRDVFEFVPLPTPVEVPRSTVIDVSARSHFFFLFPAAFFPNASRRAPLRGRSVLRSFGREEDPLSPRFLVDTSSRLIGFYRL